MDMKLNIGFTLLFALIIFCLYKFKVQLENLEHQTEYLKTKIEDLDIEEEEEETVSVSEKENELLVDAKTVINDVEQKDKSI